MAEVQFLEVEFYDWYEQWTPDQWDQWLLDLPDDAIMAKWSKRWCNWYFKCRQHERKLVLDNHREFLIDMANITMTEDKQCSKRRRDAA
jgi:hypothetical protein